MGQELIKHTGIGEAIAKLFDPYVEVVIHDLTKNKIHAIFNGFSKRKAGDLSLLSKDEEFRGLADVIGPYEKINSDGKRLKSISSVIRDEHSNPIGLFCINFDTSTFDQFYHLLGNFISPPTLNEEIDSLFKDDWRERINQYVRQYLLEHKLSFNSINRDQKKELVTHLYKVGAFDGKNAAGYIAKILQISRATVYKYLELS